MPLERLPIVFLTYNIYGIGGTVRAVVNTANYLAGAGYRVEIISVFRTSKDPIFKIDYRITVSPLLDKRKRRRIVSRVNILIFLNRYLPSWLIKKGFDDTFFNFSLVTDYLIYRTLKRLRHCILITTKPAFNYLSVKYTDRSVYKIGQEHNSFNVHPIKVQEQIKSSYDKLDCLVTLTDVDKTRYQSLFRNGAPLIVKIENGIVIPSTQTTTRKQIVVAAGRLSYEKGFDLLINAFSSITQLYPSWQLDIFGSGIERINLQKQIENLGLADRITLHGPTSDVNSVFSDASIFALPSRREGFGMVIIEAMSNGLPVIAFDCPNGPREIIDNFVDGILVEKANTRELSSAISMLIDDELLRGKLARNALSKAKRYSIVSVGAKWEALFSDTLNRRSTHKG